MKRRISNIFIVILICFILVGCKDKKNLKISLYSNGSTGYKWTYQVDKNDIIDISMKYDDSGCPPKTAGCGGHEIYTIKGIKPGKVTLSFDYSFITPDKYPSKTAIYEITVNNDLSIKETHYGTYFDEEE